MLNFLFGQPKECFHNKITPDIQGGYCPDCGEYIENQWFLTRCSCCGIKHQTIILKGEIKPSEKFCKNCGSGNYEVIKLQKINFVDIHYAIVVKKIVENSKGNFFQTWIEKETPIAFIAQKAL